MSSMSWQKECVSAGIAWSLKHELCLDRMINDEVERRGREKGCRMPSLFPRGCLAGHTFCTDLSYSHIQVLMFLHSWLLFAARGMPEMHRSSILSPLSILSSHISLDIPSINDTTHLSTSISAHEAKRIGEIGETPYRFETIKRC